MSLTDIEKEILAEGKRIRAAALRGALEARKLHLAAELGKIEEELKSLVAEVEDVVKPKPKPKAAAADKPEPEAKKAERDVS